MKLDQWAIQHGVDEFAMAHLRQILTGVDTEAVPIEGTSEAAVQAAVRIEASQKGMRLWRNNVGVLYDDTGRPVRYGLCNDSKQMNQRVKSHDLIGIRPVRITQCMVGTIIGQFVSREVKAEGWSYKGTPREEAQMVFAELILAMGGDASFTDHVGTL